MSVAGHSAQIRTAMSMQVNSRSLWFHNSAIIMRQRSEMPSAAIFLASNDASICFLAACLYVGTFRAKVLKVGVVMILMETQKLQNLFYW